tara:strand:+ start:384 stop:809 length:426 start_codon:yes stop_codon:yes gene_type:complete
MTELQQNFNNIVRRMKEKYDAKEDLFRYPPCIVPAWESIIDEMIELVEEWNAKSVPRAHLRFFQIKEKFGHLTVYLEPIDGTGVVETPDGIRKKINAMAREAVKICRVCGRQKVETVHESRVQWRCLEHYQNDNQWRIREC